jgi:PIN domain nuclease of toxin-antitoxin system
MASTNWQSCQSMQSTSGALTWQRNHPFDRTMVAQASRLGLTLASADAAIRAYRTVPQARAG